MKILQPLTIANAGFIASSVGEPDTGEVAWNAATSYTPGQRVVLASTHRVYRNLIAGVNATSPHLAPDRWFDEGPTNKWAWADTSVSTATSAPSPYTHTLQPGSFTDVALFGLVNVYSARLEVWYESGGALTFAQTLTTEYWSAGDPYISYYFDLPRFRNRLFFSGIPISATCECRLTLTALDSALPVQIGVAAYGRFEPVGCQEYGASARTVDYSRITTDEYGNTTIVKGRKAKDLRGTLVVDKAQAGVVDDLIDRLRGTPLVVVGSDDPDYDYLSTIGLVDAEPVAAGPTHATINYTVRGLV